MKSIAEGVETDEQFNLLKELGCDCIQGFLLSKPLDVEKFKTMLV
jgi:EAL domain-containing protein (putative c-di-GMP-specific phosphodiesterase class I)